MILVPPWKFWLPSRGRGGEEWLMYIQMLLVLMTPLLTPRTSVCVTLLSSDWSSSSTSSSSHSVLFSKFLWTRQSQNTWGCIIRLVITHHPQLHLNQHNHQLLWDLKLSNSEIIHLCCKIPKKRYFLQVSLNTRFGVENLEMLQNLAEFWE